MDLNAALNLSAKNLLASRAVWSATAASRVVSLLTEGGSYS